ncbi:DUF3801 domain-containing protein [Lysinibacillus xylanilyticus]|uniref:DUF3801 domain-containing protein n=1 Tax=Lysinibacillus xylanilyticus TaxID=582475 RepID=UPI003D0812BE
MVSVDEHTQVGIEIMSQGVKLSEQLLLKVLESLIERLGKNKEEQNFVIENNTKEGKQKITDLMNKHKDGVVALDDNITKQQLNDYQKEFKKMGVDFSVVKNEKDNYSFFFAGQQSNIIEKALKNVVERKSNVLENKQVSNDQSDLKAPKGKNANEVSKENKELSQAEKQKSSSIYSINGVKEIDAKIKSEQKDQSKVKTRKPSLDR